MNVRHHPCYIVYRCDPLINSCRRWKSTSEQSSDESPLWSLACIWDWILFHPAWCGHLIWILLFVNLIREHAGHHHAIESRSLTLYVTDRFQSFHRINDKPVKWICLDILIWLCSSSLVLVYWQCQIFGCGNIVVSRIILYVVKSCSKYHLIVSHPERSTNFSIDELWTVAVNSVDSFACLEPTSAIPAQSVQLNLVTKRL